MYKLLLTAFIAILLLNKSFSQLGFSQLKSYIHLPYDSLDEILTKKGYTFFDTKESPENNTTSSIWTSKNGNMLGILSTPDTITLLSDGIYTGYTDVIKKSIRFISNDLPTCNKMLLEIKNSLARLQNYTKGKTIVSTYKNDEYFVTVTKDIIHNKTGYFILIDHLAYEVFEQHFKF